MLVVMHLRRDVGCPLVYIGDTPDQVGYSRVVPHLMTDLFVQARSRKKSQILSPANAARNVHLKGEYFWYHTDPHSQWKGQFFLTAWDCISRRKTRIDQCNVL